MGSPPVRRLATVDDTRELGRRLGAIVRAGDLVVLNGPLGAGKTALVQGIGAGMGVQGRIASPTFVIARVHPRPRRATRRWCTWTPTGSLHWMRWTTSTWTSTPRVR